MTKRPMTIEECCATIGIPRNLLEAIKMAGVYSNDQDLSVKLFDDLVCQLHFDGDKVAMTSHFAKECTYAT